MGLGSSRAGRVCRAGGSGPDRRVCTRRAHWEGQGGRLTRRRRGRGRLARRGKGRGRLAIGGRGSLGRCGRRRLPPGLRGRRRGALVGRGACRLGRRGGGRRGRRGGRCGDRSGRVSQRRESSAGGTGRGNACRRARQTSRRRLARQPAPSARVIPRRRFRLLAALLRAGSGALGGDIDTRAAIGAQPSSAGLKGLDVQFLPTSRTIESDAHFTTPTDVASLEPSPGPGCLSLGPGAEPRTLDAQR